MSDDASTAKNVSGKEAMSLKPMDSRLFTSAEVGLASSNVRLAASAFAFAREGIVMLSSDKTVTDANGAFTRLTGLSLDDVLGKCVGEVFPLFVYGMDMGHIWEEVTRQGLWQGTLRSDVCEQSGTLYSIYLQVVDLDNNGHCLRYICFLSDVGRYERREKHLRSLAETDALTGLANRSLILLSITESIDRVKSGGVAPSVLFLDLDGFKNVNDHLGHGRGDQLLCDVARRLENCVRANDLVARLGGDEFVILFHGVDRDALKKTAETIVERLAFSLVGDDGCCIGVSCSVGIASFPVDGKSVLNLLQSADTAMYAVKREGKKGYRFATIISNAI